jgi:hypothetical protein
MKTVSIREMKAHWSEIEGQVREGESFLVLNRGKYLMMNMISVPHMHLKQSPVEFFVVPVLS